MGPGAAHDLRDQRPGREGEAAGPGGEQCGEGAGRDARRNRGDARGRELGDGAGASQRRAMLRGAALDDQEGGWGGVPGEGALRVGRA